MILRDYQEKSRERIKEELAKHGKTLLVLPTGTGKTPVLAVTIEDVLKANPGKRALVVVHTEELANQAVDKIKKWTTLSVEVEMGERWAAGMTDLFESADVLVASRQTLNAGFGGRGRMTRFDPDDFILLVIDEAHHSTAKSYRTIIEYFHCKYLFGVTATPDRADEEALGQIFESAAYVYEIKKAVDDGWLVPLRSRPIVVEGLDFEKVNISRGDLNGADLERELTREGPLHKMMVPTMAHVGDRKALIFAAGVFHAKRMCEIINRELPGAARYVHGDTKKDERRQIFSGFRRGEFNYLLNVDVTTEGWDEPEVQVVVLARPTKSRAKYVQMIGRGTRPYDGLVDQYGTPLLRREAIAASGKPFIEIIDLVGNNGKHRLISLADILGGNESDAVVDKARQLIQEKSTKSDQPVDVQDAIGQAKRIIQEELEASRRKHIKAAVRWTSTIVNPFDLLGLTPWRVPGWEKAEPATEAQVGALRRRDIPIPQDGLTKKNATQLLNELEKRRAAEPCSANQSRVLRRFGYKTEEITGREASKLIDALKANGWKRTKEVTAA